MASGNSSSYLLAILLELKDRASSGLDKFAARLTLLGKQSKEFAAAWKELEKMGGKGGGSASATGSAQQEARAVRETVKLRQEQVRLGREEARESKAKADSTTHRLRAEREATKLQQEQARLSQIRSRTSNAEQLADVRLLREQVKLQKELSQLRSGRGGWADRFNRTVNTGRNAAYLAERTYDTVRGFTDPAMEQHRARERFRIMGFSPQENARADAGVEQVAQNIKGVKRSDLYETLNGLINTFGDVDESLRFLEVSAKYRANMQALYGDVYGPSEVTRQIGNTFKALETLGIDRPTGPRDASGQPTFSNEDRARMERYFNIVAQATAATGGEVNPNEFRLFTKYSRLAGQGLTPEGLKSLIPVMQQFGGASTGTALQTLYANMVGGRIPAHKLRYWDELGLLDTSKAEFNKQGQLKRLRPGAIPIAEGLGRDPIAVADKLAGVFKNKGIDVKDYDAVNKQLMAMFGDRTGAGLLAQMINFRASIEKEVKKNERALGIDETYKQIYETKNPLGQIQTFQAAKTDALATGGKPIMELTGSVSEFLAEQLKNLQSTSGEHPAMSAAMVGILSLGKASADAAQGVGLLDTVARTVGGATGASGGGPSVDTSDILTGGWAVGKALRWGGSALLGIGSRLAGPLAIASTAYLSLSAIHDQYEHDQKERVSARADAALKLEDIRKLREQHGGRIPDDLAAKLSREAFPGVNRAGLLNTLDLKTYGTPGYPGMMTGPSYDRDAVMAGEFARRAPQLAFPELLRPFLDDLKRQVAEGKINQGGGEYIQRIAEKAFPESYKAATQTATQQIQELSQSIKPVGATMMDLHTQSKPLPPSFLRLNESVTGLPGAFYSLSEAISANAARINSIEYNPPSQPPGPTVDGGRRSSIKIPDLSNPDNWNFEKQSLNDTGARGESRGAFPTLLASETPYTDKARGGAPFVTQANWRGGGFTEAPTMRLSATPAAPPRPKTLPQLPSPDRSGGYYEPATLRRSTLSDIAGASRFTTFQKLELNLTYNASTSTDDPKAHARQIAQHVKDELEDMFYRLERDSERA